MVALREGRLMGRTCPHCNRPLARVLDTGKPQLALRALAAKGDLPCSALSEVIDDISAYTARTMSKLVDKGLAVNLRPPGKRALYRITADGRRAIGLPEPA